MDPVDYVIWDNVIQWWVLVDLDIRQGRSYGACYCVSKWSCQCLCSSTEAVPSPFYSVHCLSVTICFSCFFSSKGRKSCALPKEISGYSVVPYIWKVSLPLNIFSYILRYSNFFSQNHNFYMCATMCDSSFGVNAGALSFALNLPVCLNDDTW